MRSFLIALTRNPLSLLGAAITTASAVLIVTLFGIELIGSPQSAEDDAQVFNLTVDACQAAGLRSFEVKMGDLGLFAALINSLDIPEQWRARIKQIPHKGRFVLLGTVSMRKNRVRLHISSQAGQQELPNLFQTLPANGSEITDTPFSQFR